MDRKPYVITLATPRGETATVVLLTEVEADTVRFVAEGIISAVKDGAIDAFEVEEARGDCAGCGGLGEYPSWSGTPCETCKGVGTVPADSPDALNGAVVEGTAVRP
ncbi:hypothetical protein [Micromonospora okii]|uniref:hypothetical protein n=1 Tax=Micromonospora okii TaxID=1182970 RepID=UPI001E4ED443|nr:hypothetical protein [Micromonospora okii]